MTILVITTGGTISALPTDDHRKETLATTLVQSTGRDLVREQLEKKPGFQGRFITLEFRDSRVMDELYRMNMLKLAEEGPEDKVLITHGTDALLQTANFLYRQAKDNAALAGKVILLTGAMISLAEGPDSDGYLNLDFAVGQLGKLTPAGGENIYIVLCDYESSATASGEWKPRLYKYAPNTYEKAYNADGRYNRLKKVK